MFHNRWGNRRWICAVAALAATVPLLVAASYPPRGDDQPYPFSPSGLSTKRFAAVTVPEDTHVLAHDGVPLRAQVYRPDTTLDPNWKTPVILVHSPYFDSAHSLRPLGFTVDQGDPIDAVVQRYTPHGYTVVKSSMRGTGRSGGCFDNWGPDDAADFKTLVEHFADQPWSNGRVASWGASAEGMTTNAALDLAPRGLVTSVVMLATSGMYDTYGFDGVPYSVRHLAPTQQSAWMLLDAPSAALGGEPSVCTNFPEPEQAKRSGTMTPYFQDREFRTGLEQTEASVLYVAHLHDRMVLPIAIDGFYDRLPTFKRAIFSPLPHAYPWDAPDELRREDWWAMFDAWFDHELLGLPTGISAWPPVQVQDERNVWRAVPSYAEMGTPEAHALGAGTIGGPRAEQHVVQISETGPPASWTTDELTGELHLSGQARLTAPIVIDRNEAHFMLTLQELRSDGSVRTLTNGFLSAQHRDSLTDPTPVQAGKETTYDIRTHPFDAWVAAGSKIQLMLSGNDDYEAWLAEGLQASGEPEGNLFTGTVAVDGRAVLELPIANDTCGLKVQQTQAPRGTVRGCPARIWAQWRSTP